MGRETGNTAAWNVHMTSREMFEERFAAGKDLCSGVGSVLLYLYQLKRCYL